MHASLELENVCFHILLSFSAALAFPGGSCFAVWTSIYKIKYSKFVRQICTSVCSVRVRRTTSIEVYHIFIYKYFFNANRTINNAKAAIFNHAQNADVMYANMARIHHTFILYASRSPYFLGQRKIKKLEKIY